MKKSDYRYFYHTDFLDKSLHDTVFYSKELIWEDGLLINEQGEFSKTEGDGVLKNRYKDDDTIIFQHLTPNLRQIAKEVKNSLINQGSVNPILFNLNPIHNPDPDSLTQGYGWHKDFNLVEHIQDETKLWIVMLIFAKDKINSRLKVSPTPEGPGLWNIGFDLELTPNFMMAHTINLGHDYTVGDLNNLDLLYMRWYEANYSDIE